MELLHVRSESPEETGERIRGQFAEIGIDPANVHDLGGPFPAFATLLRMRPRRMNRAFTDCFELFVPTRPMELTEHTGGYAGKHFSYRRGMVAFNPPGAEWTIEWSGMLEGLSFLITPQVMDAAVRDLFQEDPTELTWRQAFCDNAPAIAYLGLDLVSQASIGYPAGERHFEHVLRSTISLMIRRYATTPSRNTASVGIMSRTILSAMQFIEQNFDQELSVERIAEAAASSSPQLNRQFRSELGKSVWAYVRHRRLSKAAELLTRTADPVAQISIRVGYPNRSNFSEAFSAEFGASPSDYRRARAAAS